MSSQSEPGIAGLLLRADTAGGTATEFRGSCVKHIRVRDWRNAQFKCNPVALWPLSGSWSFVFFSRLGAKCCRRERMRARIECVAEEKRSIPSSFPLVDHPVFFFFYRETKEQLLDLEMIIYWAYPVSVQRASVMLSVILHLRPILLLLLLRPPLMCDFIQFFPRLLTVWFSLFNPSCRVASSYTFYDEIWKHTIISGAGLAQHGRRRMAENERVMALPQT